MNRLALVFFHIISISLLQGQQTSQKPKLVVGVIVDQMRFDQLYKYEKRFGENGFRRLLREGYNFKNTHVNYIPSETAPGHASIYTGATPAYHGIIGNSWYDRDSGVFIGNVEDTEEKIIGSVRDNPYGVSPKNLMATTLSDELRSGSNFKSKVISVSIKDRGAILPGGRSPNAAYWHDWESSPGYFVTSSFYMKKVPKWVKNFNELQKSDAYLNETWNTLYPVETYTASVADDNAHEPSLGGKPSPTFPYDFKTIREKYRPSGTEYKLLWSSPGGNSLLTEFAIAAIKNEKLGKDEHTDLLNVSYSVPDVVGHTFGPQSVEMEDIYLRLDQNLAQLFTVLDNTVGKDSYTLFLTADHGANLTASHLHENKIFADIARIKKYRDGLQDFLVKKYGTGNWIQNFEGNNVYLNKTLIDDKKLQFTIVQREVADFLMTQKEVRMALTAHDLQTNNYEDGMRKTIQQGYHPKRCGDVLVAFNSGIIIHRDSEIDVARTKGTVHGTGYSYDTHIPLLWMGVGISSGESVQKVHATDIVPSLALFLGIQMPSAVQGNPLPGILRN